MRNKKRLCIIALLLILLCAYAVILLCKIVAQADEAEAKEIQGEKFIRVSEQKEVFEEIDEEGVIDDVWLFAKVVMGEAGAEPLIGKIAVATTILNRMDMFDMTASEVLKQKNQYFTDYKGTITNDVYDAIEKALEERDLFPRTMIYFRTKHYHSYGTPYTQIGSHYFSCEEVSE